MVQAIATELDPSTTVFQRKCFVRRVRYFSPTLASSSNIDITTVNNILSNPVPSELRDRDRQIFVPGLNPNICN